MKIEDPKHNYLGITQINPKEVGKCYVRSELHKITPAAINQIVDALKKERVMGWGNLISKKQDEIGSEAWMSLINLTDDDLRCIKWSEGQILTLNHAKQKMEKLIEENKKLKEDYENLLTSIQDKS